ncbi:CHASE2 domain-containing protein [Paludibaculum fermentans]|uniref:CHASE2 domain-containing protein n=1 Tax=Paludibaculum fermentans TaxID=1473598 RepID=UPI003EB699BA
MQNVALMTLQQGREPQSLMGVDPGPRREYLMRLVDVIDSHYNPQKIVVLDFAFEATKIDLTVKDALRQTIARVKDPQDIVVACDDRDVARLRHLPTEILRQLERHNAVLRQEGEELPHPTGKNVECGLSTFPADTRRIPLGWRSYLAAPPVQTARLELQYEGVRKSLSYIAAERFFKDERSGLPSHELADPPYSILYQRNEFLEVAASSVLRCTPEQSYASDWAACSPDKTVLNQLGRASVVLLGSVRGEDFHPTPAGPMPGVVLHANYIEALTSKTLFFPSEWAGILVSFLLFCAIEWSQEHYGLVRAWSLTLAASACTFALAYVLFVLFRVYLTLWLPSLIVLLLKYTVPRLARHYESLTATYETINPAHR